MKSTVRAVLVSLALGAFLAAPGLFAEAAAPGPDAALRMLKDGNQRFSKAARTMPDLDAGRRQDVAKNGQKPYATILGCADSRVPLEHVFDAGIGDLFVIRVAGNVADTDEIGTIEYGVEHLKSPVVVVLGHSGCGAVTAVVRGDTVGGSIPALVDNIIPAAAWARKETPGAPEADIISASIQQNVWQSIQDLLTRSSITVELVKEGKLKVVGALYNLSSGEVTWLGEHPRQAALLSAAEKTGEGGAAEEKPAAAAAGKDAAAAPGTAPSPWLRSFIVAAGACLFLLLAYLVLASGRLRIKRMKARTRLVLCSLASIAVLAAGAVTALRTLQGPPSSALTGQLLFQAGVPALAALVFSLAYVGAVSRAFREHVAALKAQIP